MLKVVFTSFGLIQIVFLFKSYYQMGTYRKASELVTLGDFYTPLIVACSDPANFDARHQILSASSNNDNGGEQPTFNRTKTVWKVRLQIITPRARHERGGLKRNQPKS